MAPKKVNGFMQFTFDWKEKNGQSMNLAQATSITGELWEKMTPAQREPYNKRAQTTAPKHVPKAKLTCLGTPIELVEKQHREKLQREAYIKKYIESTVKLALESDKLKNKEFYFVMVNYFIRILHTDKYVPAEIGIIKFSLEAGVMDTFHRFVNPNTNFYGNVYEAQHHSDNTHKLPLPPDAMGENMTKVLADILKFIKTDANGLYPPLYTNSIAINYVSSALKYLSDEKDNGLDWEIYPLQQLFYTLKCASSDYSGIVKPKNHFVTNAVIERDTFEYTNNIACDYHEEIDRSNYCAISQCIRWAYIFADYICKDLSITYIPGKHMPDLVNANIVMRTKDSSFDKQSRIDFSTLSLQSTYESCSDFETCSTKSHLSSYMNYPTAKPKTQQNWNNDHDDIFNSVSEADYNPWKRYDDSKPPDERFFSLDHSDNNDNPSTSRRFVGRGRGRGIAILNDIKYAN